MNISGIILAVLIATTVPAYASNESLRTQGLVAASVLLVAGGTIVLCRRSYSKFDKIFEVIGGAILIAAGVAGIVLSGEISQKIEQLYYK